MNTFFFVNRQFMVECTLQDTITWPSAYPWNIDLMFQHVQARFHIFICQNVAAIC